MKLTQTLLIHTVLLLLSLQPINTWHSMWLGTMYGHRVNHNIKVCHTSLSHKTMCYLSRWTLTRLQPRAVQSDASRLPSRSLQCLAHLVQGWPCGLFQLATFGSNMNGGSSPGAGSDTAKTAAPSSDGGAVGQKKRKKKTLGENPCLVAKVIRSWCVITTNDNRNNFSFFLNLVYVRP